MRRFGLFLAAAGRWGVSLMTGGLISFCIAGWEHLVGHSLSPLIWAPIGFGFLMAGAFLAWNDEHSKAEKLSLKLHDIQSSCPSIRMKQVILLPEVPFYTGRGTQFAAPAITIRFVNDPPVPYPNAEAKGVAAKLRFFRNKDNGQLLEIDGRWAGSEQPSKRDFRSSRLDLLKMDFGIGDERDLDVGFRDPLTGCFIAWNNDNYNYPDLIKPEHKLEGDLFRVNVRLRGPWVDESSTIYFRNTAKGMEIISEAEAQDAG